MRHPPLTVWMCWGRGIFAAPVRESQTLEPGLDPGDEGRTGPGPVFGVVLAGEEVGQLVTQGHKSMPGRMEHDFAVVRDRPPPGERWRRHSIFWGQADIPGRGGVGPAPGRKPRRSVEPRFPVPETGATPAAAHRSDGSPGTRPGRQKPGRHVGPDRSGCRTGGSSWDFKVSLHCCRFTTRGPGAARGSWLPNRIKGPQCPRGQKS